MRDQSHTTGSSMVITSLGLSPGRGREALVIEGDTATPGAPPLLYIYSSGGVGVLKYTEYTPHTHAPHPHVTCAHIALRVAVSRAT